MDYFYRGLKKVMNNTSMLWHMHDLNRKRSRNGLNGRCL